MNLFATSFIRHILPVVAAYVASPELQETISVGVAAAIAFVWSAVEKQLTGTGSPQKK